VVGGIVVRDEGDAAIALSEDDAAVAGIEGEAGLVRVSMGSPPCAAEAEEDEDAEPEGFPAVDGARGHGGDGGAAG